MTIRKIALALAAAGTLTAGLAASPAHAEAATSKHCGSVYGQSVTAGAVTSCALARDVARRASNGGVPYFVRGYSSVTGRTYGLWMWRNSYGWSGRTVVYRGRGANGNIAVTLRSW